MVHIPWVLLLGMAEAESTRIGQIALRCGFVRGEQLENCLKHQITLRTKGIELKLGQILIRYDAISTTQLVELLERQRKLRATA